MTQDTTTVFKREHFSCDTTHGGFCYHADANELRLAPGDFPARFTMDGETFVLDGVKRDGSKVYIVSNTTISAIIWND